MSDTAGLSADIAEELERLGMLPPTDVPLQRHAFEQLSERDKRRHLRRGGTVTENPPPAPPRLGANQAYRSSFDGWAPEHRRIFIEGGGTLLDDPTRSAA